jgi:hypothetical protein
VRLIFALLLALIALPASAGLAPATDAFGMHLGSWHSNQDACFGQIRADCNNANPGGYLRRDGWVVGGYYNSIKRPTVYAGRIWELGSRGRLSFDLGAVLATGYEAAPVVPLATPTVGLELGKGWRARVLYLPRVGDVSPTHVLHLSIERELSR